MDENTRGPDAQSEASPNHAVPEPRVIQECRQIIAKLTDLVNAADVEALSVYIEGRDGGYRNLQAGSPSCHEDAGRILEMAILRLGFVQRE